MGLAIVLVQHLDPRQESMLAKLLARTSRMPVVEVKEGMQVTRDRVYVIPPNKALEIRDRTLHLLKRRKSEGPHMPIDDFFVSLAENEGNRAIGVVLSGLASDGTRGLMTIKHAGGITFAQEPGSAKYSGMPQSAIASGCVDLVLPPKEIAEELKRIGTHPYVARREPAALAEPSFARDKTLQVLTLIRVVTGVDFTRYKSSTVHRRIARRMALRKIPKLPQYLEYLRAHRAEVTALCEDILVHVTGFFREPETFRTLKETVLPKILSGKRPGEPLRIWVAGCSTGEEAYSVAIVVAESLQQQMRTTPIQIFATDIGEGALEKARSGLYSESLMSGVSRDRIDQFFVRVNGGYQVSKSIRELCIFARQDLSKDPPYSRLDLLICRNVLIYMEPVLQKRLLSFFHYALNPNGYLVLGSSESVGRMSDLFSPVGRDGKIYAKKASSRPLPLGLPPEPSRPEPLKFPELAGAQAPFDIQKEADRIVLNQYTPPGLVVNEDHQILHFRGNVAPYLSPSPGHASLNVLKMVRPEFAIELRAALHRAQRQDTPARTNRIQVRRNGHLKEASLEVVPFKSQANGRFFLILLQESPVPKTESGSRSKIRRTAEAEIGLLRRELQATKEHLQSINEEHEAANEELKSANEEILSSNEELNSTNEELQTAQEELQSSNEELITINEQLQNRNQELTQLSDDWTNLLSGLNIPVVILGRDRRILRFTGPAEQLLNLLPADIGRPIANIRPNFEFRHLDPLISRVMETSSPQEQEIRDREGRWYSMRLRPYRTADNRVAGVLIIFIDVHALKTTQQSLAEQSSFSAAMMESSGALVLVTEADGRVVAFNHACQMISGYTLDDVAGKVLWDLPLVTKDDIEQVKSIHRRLIAGRAPVQHESHWITKAGARCLISWNFAALPAFPGRPRHIVRVGTDITERVEIENALKASEAALRQSQGQLQALTAGLLKAQEQERARVARELHDDISQKLAALSLATENALRREAKNPEELRKEIARLSQSLGGILTDVEHTARQLHPSTLDHLGLGAAIKAYCSEFSRQNDIAVQYSERNLPRAVSSPVALAVYRVVQEALRNVAKHSHATRASVSVDGGEGSVVLTVRDSGRGFDPARSRKGGLGLISMEERVRQVKGTFRLTAEPGKGVSIQAAIPLQTASRSGKIRKDLRK